MSKVTLTTLTSLTNEATALSQLGNNNTALTAAIENTLSRDGTSPNTMGASLDMNSNRILNLPAPVANSEPARLIDVGDAPISAAAASANAAAALVSQNAAAASATTASTAATNAGTSATNAATSATNAGTSATNAAASALTAANNATITGGNFYNFATSTTMADPSSANVRFNNATPASVTAIAFSSNTADTGNPNIRTFLAAWGASSSSNKGTIIIRKAGSPSIFAIYTTTASSTDNTTWVQQTVAYVTGNGTFSAADSLSVQFTRSGDTGSGSISGAVNHGVGLATGASSMTSTAVMTDGQLLVGQSAADPLPKTITGDVTFTAAGATAIKSGVSLAGTTTVAALTNTGITTNSAVSAGMEHGSTASSNTPYMDWHSSGNANDYDFRMIASSGAVGVGLGTMTFNGATLALQAASGQTTFFLGSAGVTGGAFVIAGSSSGSTTFNTPAAASGTVQLPNGGTFTGSSASAVWYDNIPQNSQSVAYQLVASDAQKHILHPSADTTARTITIPANSTVAFPIGTVVTFVNQASAGVMTIAITTDTMRLAGAGTTGNRTLAANGIATALKITSTEWIISGTGLS